MTEKLAADSGAERAPEEFPPDCPEGENCKKCHKCFSHYVEAKMAGELND